MKRFYNAKAFYIHLAKKRQCLCIEHTQKFNFSLTNDVISLNNRAMFYCFQAGSAARQGLHELETVISNATSLGLKLPVSTRMIILS